MFELKKELYLEKGGSYVRPISSDDSDSGYFPLAQPGRDLPCRSPGFRAGLLSDPLSTRPAWRAQADAEVNIYYRAVDSGTMKCTLREYSIVMNH